uniref:Uncharacterized protein n=1 Tax=Meloidogyne incognita TaxID=6306 RepID=A0A914NLK1_MELIC
MLLFEISMASYNDGSFYSFAGDAFATTGAVIAGCAVSAATDCMSFEGIMKTVGLPPGVAAGTNTGIIPGAIL